MCAVGDAFDPCGADNQGQGVSSAKESVHHVSGLFLSMSSVTPNLDSNWIFLAGLIILTNSFFNVYDNAENDSMAQIAVQLHEHLSPADPLAARYVQILNAFMKVIADSRAARMQQQQQQQQRDYKHDPIEGLLSAKPNTPASIGRGTAPSSMPSYESQTPVWNWSSKVTSTEVMPSMLAGDLFADGFGESVEGLIPSGSEEGLGPDLGPILEEVIHFDNLWPLNEDPGLFPGNIPMYGTNHYL